ncbi:uncharacterized protein CLUP02_03449 [Colletotrichum lupini]|uniref:Uncharacterized protein n=1 Tax=Colletotrichum lupini TaxID=145971 RepID=A0A9Q8WCC9_9PEZI|nr:uncharacterized protein CLUP02_03449 [Colletotrichum lupini]UQC77976.1 hypothetical protein CLUP02_03449 [Colletotrichum lupini]
MSLMDNCFPSIASHELQASMRLAEALPNSDVFSKMCLLAATLPTYQPQYCPLPTNSFASPTSN